MDELDARIIGNTTLAELDSRALKAIAERRANGDAAEVDLLIGVYHRHRQLVLERDALRYELLFKGLRSKPD